MDINETILALVKAQSELLLYLVERQTMMHCALEAFVRQEAQDFDSYTELRAQLFQEEFSGKLNVLLQTLRMTLDHTNTSPSWHDLWFPFPYSPRITKEPLSKMRQYSVKAILE